MMRTLTFVVLLFVACQKTPETQRIAVVDMRRAVAESKPGLAAQERLKKHFDVMQTSLNEEQAQLKREPNDEKLLALQARFERLQQELKDMEAKETAPILKDVGVQLERIAKEKQLDVVFDVQNVPWMKPEVDLTDDVIRALE